MSKPKHEPREITEPSDAEQTYAWLDYRGKVGPEADVDHEGEAVFVAADFESLPVPPGLSRVARDTWQRFRDLPSVALRLADKSLDVVNGDLSKYATSGARRDLVSRTTDPDALEHILELEKARSRAGTQKERRDDRVVEIAKKKLDRKARPLDFSTLPRLAAAAG
jgi:hypothetical protein